jgi:predicted anti-sigma-YlaC factor YlaD
MTCREAIALMGDYLESLLNDEALAELEAHFRDCAPCRAYFNTYRRTRDVAGAEGRVEMPPEMKERLEAFLIERILKSSS